MATDGPKLIDSDTAHDTYWGIMDMYDNEVSSDEIKQEFPYDIDSYDDFEYEIYLTSLALAFWEIGLMDDTLLKKVNETVAKGIGVKEWTEECDEKIGKQRQQTLNRLIKKISKENGKIRKPKKYRKVTNFHFQPNDLLAFKLSNEEYRVVLCAGITQKRGECTYNLVGTTYKSKIKPNVEAILNCDISGHWIPTSFDIETILEMHPEIDKLWEKFPKNKKKFWGLSYIMVSHKDLYTLKDKFIKVGNLALRESYLQGGSYRGEDSFERFEEMFFDYENHIKIFRCERMPLKILCEKN